MTTEHIVVLYRGEHKKIDKDGSDEPNNLTFEKGQPMLINLRNMSYIRPGARKNMFKLKMLDSTEEMVVWSERPTVSVLCEPAQVEAWTTRK